MPLPCYLVRRSSSRSGQRRARKRGSLGLTMEGGAQGSALVCRGGDRILSHDVRLRSNAHLNPSEIPSYRSSYHLPLGSHRPIVLVCFPWPYAVSLLQKGLLRGVEAIIYSTHIIAFPFLWIDAICGSRKLHTQAGADLEQCVDLPRKGVDKHQIIEGKSRTTSIVGSRIPRCVF